MLQQILLQFGWVLCDVLSIAIFIQILIAWTLGTHNNGYKLLDSLTWPVMRVAKRVIPPAGMLDFSPMVAMFGLEIIKSIWSALIMAIL